MGACPIPGQAPSGQALLNGLSPLLLRLAEGQVIGAGHDPDDVPVLENGEMSDVVRQEEVLHLPHRGLPVGVDDLPGHVRFYREMHLR